MAIYAPDVRYLSPSANSAISSNNNDNVFYFRVNGDNVNSYFLNYANGSSIEKATFNSNIIPTALTGDELNDGSLIAINGNKANFSSSSPVNIWRVEQYGESKILTTDSSPYNTTSWWSYWKNLSITNGSSSYNDQNQTILITPADNSTASIDGGFITEGVLPSSKRNTLFTLSDNGVGLSVTLSSSQSVYYSYVSYNVAIYDSSYEVIGYSHGYFKAMNNYTLGAYIFVSPAIEGAKYFGLKITDINKPYYLNIEPYMSDSDIYYCKNHGFNSGDQILSFAACAYYIMYTSVPMTPLSNIVDSTTFLSYVNVIDKDHIKLFVEKSDALVGSFQNNTDLSFQLYAPFNNIEIVATAASVAIPVNIVNELNSFYLESKTLTSSSNTISPTFSSPNGTTIKTWCAFMYLNDILVETSGEINTQNPSYTFNGMINGNTYQIQFTAMDSQNKIYDTGLIPFTVSYNPLNSNLDISVTADCINSCIIVDVGNVFSLYGGTYPLGPDNEYTGYSKVSNFYIPDNNAISINPNYVLQFPRNDNFHETYTLGINNESNSLLFIWQTSSSNFYGPVVSFNADDGTQRVVYIEDGLIWIKQGDLKVNCGLANISPNQPYLVGVYNNKAVFSPYNYWEHNILNFPLQNSKNIL